MRPSDVRFTPNKPRRARTIAKPGTPSRYHLVPIDQTERDAKDRAEAKGIAERARADEAAALEAAGALLRRGGSR